MTRILIAGLRWTNTHPFLAAVLALAIWLVGAVTVDTTVDGLGTQTSTLVGGLLGLPLTGVVVVAVLGHLEDVGWQPVLATRRTSALRALDALAITVAGLLGAEEPQATRQSADREHHLDDAGQFRPITRPDAPLVLEPESDDFLGTVAAIQAARTELLHMMSAARSEPLGPLNESVASRADDLRTRLTDFLERARDSGFVPLVVATQTVDVNRREREVRAGPAAVDLQHCGDTAVSELSALMEQCRDAAEVQVLDALLHSARKAADDVARMVSAAEYLHAWLEPPLHIPDADQLYIVVSYYFRQFPESAASLSVVLRVT